ncbi:prolipoprotein diacylglyceryl transferase [Nesterenkonia natronophila]|uniref:Phosphatidylglycerol--prolipoprotein diacylglyceryl transferase n=1 Tax=Nesterenkonia natronophila TaxID=2174932 RepID=A0A3A4FE77_9MICC|nr:prolipoprotein diacylglyceryl transferase [Nesterenkonia natronophila]RJN33114.1 prolipoprotein diacylglyceryl transferase [Nesterenkonia natronophila]
MTLSALPFGAQTLSGFPPPPVRGIDLPGPFFIAFYTLVIMIGIVLAVVVATRLWKSRGGQSDDIFSAMLWAVLIGILGARIYHVISSPDAYFGPEGDLTRIPQLWQGGLSIIGAVMAGAVAVWIFCRRNGIKFGAFADAIVPGVLLAQALGRWGNWFNQELFGRATDLPWGLSIDTDQQHQGLTGSLPAYAADGGLFHPTFLYESLWNLLGFFALIVLFKRFQFRQGLIAWTYVAYYALGRFWIESMRIDEVNKSTQYPLRDVMGLDWRLNQIIAFVIFVVAAVVLVRLFMTRPRTLEEIAEHTEIYTPGSPHRAKDTALVDGAGIGDTAETASEPSLDQPPGAGPRSEN